MTTTKKMLYTAVTLLKGSVNQLDSNKRDLINNFLEEYEQMFVPVTPLDDGPIFELDKNLNVKLNSLYNIFGETKGAM